MKRKEVRYFAFILFAILLGMTGYNSVFKAQTIAVSQATASTPSGQQAGGELPPSWIGSAKLSPLLSVVLDGFVEFRSTDNNNVLVRHSIGVEKPTEVAAQSVNKADGSTTIKWTTGYDSYEFQVADGESEASLMVTRNGVLYLVLMNTEEQYVQTQASSNFASRMLDNAVSVLLEAAVLLLPMWIVLVISYALVAGLVYLIFWKWLRKTVDRRKIQPRLPQQGMVSFEIKHSLVAALAIGLFSFLLVWLIATGYSQSYREISEYGWGYWAFSLVLLLVLVDAYVYWTHRAMHHPKLFKYFHNIHHNSNRPTPWATWSMNVNEVMVNALFVPIVILVVPLHEMTLIVFSVISIVKNVFNHLGFEIFPKGANKGILKWIVTPTYHEMHHIHFNSNYSAFFTWWDKWMGTEHKNYDATFEKTHATQS